MKSLKDLTVDLGRLQQKCDEAMKVAPAIIGNMVAQDIKANFHLRNPNRSGITQMEAQ